MGKNNKQQTVQQNTQHTTYNKEGKASFKSYKDLIVYQKAKESTIKLIRHYSDRKLSWTERYLVDQLIRAAASVGANLAEGYGRHHKRDYRRFISISRGSSFELEYWGDLIGEINSADKEFLSNVNQANKEVIKMLTAMMKSLDK